MLSFVPVQSPDTMPAPQPAIVQESAGLRALRLALAVSSIGHTMSIAQRVGVYPA